MADFIFFFFADIEFEFEIECVNYLAYLFKKFFINFTLSIIIVISYVQVFGNFL